MKLFKVLSAALVMALVVAVAPAAFAQDDMPTFGLSPEDFAEMTAANMASFSASSAAFNFTITGGISGIPDMGGDASMNLTGSGLYDTANEAFDLSVTGSLDGMGQNIPVNFSARVVNQALYFNLDGTQWMSVSGDDFDEFVEGFSNQAPVDLGSMMSGDVDMTEVMGALSTLDPTAYINMSRNGNQFSTAIDLAGLMASQEIQNALMAVASANPEAGMSEGEMAGAAAMMGVMFQNSSITLDQFVGGDGLLERVVFDISMNIDPAMMGQEGDPIIITFNLDISLSDYNGAFSVEAPADAMDLGAMSSG